MDEQLRGDASGIRPHRSADMARDTICHCLMLFTIEQRRSVTGMVDNGAALKRRQLMGGLCE